MNPNLSHNISVYEMLGSFLRNRSLIFQMNRREVFRCYRNSVLASLVVYIRDIWQMTSVLTTELLFLSPIFYPASRVPEHYQTIIYIDPLTFVIEQARDVLMWRNMSIWSGLMIATAVSLVVAWTRFAWFQRIRQGFADVL